MSSPGFPKSPTQRILKNIPLVHYFSVLLVRLAQNNCKDTWYIFDNRLAERGLDGSQAGRSVCPTVRPYLGGGRCIVPVRPVRCLAASRYKPVTVCIFASIFRAGPPLAYFEFGFTGAYGVFRAGLPDPARFVRMCLCHRVP